MKTLYIIRHAKSSWEEIWIEDFDRDLSERWKDDLKLMWKKLKEEKIYPDKIYSSSAKRAKKTCKGICKEIWYSIDKVKFNRAIYDNCMEWVDFYISYLMNIKNKHDDIFLIWHNNAWNELANYFTWKDIWNIPTLGIVKIRFDIEKWKDISYANWKLEFFIFPKML